MKVSFSTNSQYLLDIIKTITKANNIKSDIQEFTHSTYITLFNVVNIDYNIEREVFIIAYNNIGIRIHMHEITDMFIDTMQ